MSNEPMIQIPLKTAKLLDRFFLPHNPNKIRRPVGPAREEVKAACHALKREIATAEATARN